MGVVVELVVVMLKLTGHLPELVVGLLLEHGQRPVPVAQPAVELLAVQVAATLQVL